MLAVLFIAAAIAVRNDPSPGSGPSFTGGWFLGGWHQWDSLAYLDIAGNGYSYVPNTQSRVAFFPGYPLTVRTVDQVVGNLPVAGILVTAAAGLTAMQLYWRWLVERMTRSAALAALALLALYPWAWYLYGAIYGDALFLCLVLATFTLLERDRYFLAGVVGAAATATRFVGVALVAAMVVGVLERRGAIEGRGPIGLPRTIRVKRLKPSDTSVLLSLTGLLAWMSWLWHRYGDPLLFSSVQAAWGQSSSPHTWFKVDFFTRSSAGGSWLHTGILLTQGMLALALILYSPAIGRRFGARYGVYVAVAMLIPFIGSRDFQGLGRYSIGAFPAFALFGERLARLPTARQIQLLGGSVVLLLVGTVEFARGRYLS